jgi:hypothetical protein
MISNFIIPSEYEMLEALQKNTGLGGSLELQIKPRPEKTAKCVKQANA